MKKPDFVEIEHDQARQIIVEYHEMTRDELGKGVIGLGHAHLEWGEIKEIKIETNSKSKSRPEM